MFFLCLSTLLSFINIYVWTNLVDLTSEKRFKMCAYLQQNLIVFFYLFFHVCLNIYVWTDFVDVTSEKRL